MYKHAKGSLFTQRGQIIADAAGHAFINGGFAKSYKIGDAAAKSKTLDTLRAELKENGFYFELVYDATHGRRYVMFVFRASIDRDYDNRVRENIGARKLAFDFMCQPETSFYVSPSYI